MTPFQKAYLMLSFRHRVTQHRIEVCWELGGWSIVNFEVFYIYTKKGSTSSKVTDGRRFANALQLASGTVNAANWPLQLANCKDRQ